MPSLLADTFSPGQIIGIVAIIGSMLVSLFVPIFAMYFHHRKKQLWHETARIALEKGQPLSQLSTQLASMDEVIPEALRHEREQKNDLRGGLVLIGVGAGLYLFFSAMGIAALRYVGAIPGLIGVALLLYALLEAVFGRKNPPSDDRSPRA